MGSNDLTAGDGIFQCLHLIRGQRVILDRDLAVLYGVTTKVLNQAVRRNSGRFPPEFMFRLTRDELEEVVTNCDHLRPLRFSHQLPYAFTEHGVAMLSSVLRSPRAIEVNIRIIKVFVRLRDMVSVHRELALRLRELESRVSGHDVDIQSLIDEIRQLTSLPDPPQKKIGFRPA